MDRRQIDDTELYRLTPRLKQLGADNGLSLNTMRQRMFRGWLPVDAASIPVYKHLKTAKFDEYVAVAERNGIPRAQFFQRVLAGWDPARASSQPLRVVKRHLTDEQLNLMKNSGVSRSTFNARMKRGWSMVDALTLPPQPKYHHGGKK